MVYTKLKKFWNSTIPISNIIGLIVGYFIGGKSNLIRRIGMVLAIFFLSCNCIGCKTLGISDNNSKEETPIINSEIIKAQVERSEMPDGGYRFANAEYEKQLSAYATYYIREAKKKSGLKIMDLSGTAETVFIENFVNVSSLNLTDIYCVIFMLKDKNCISKEIKKNILTYLDSLYNSKIGCYVLPATKDDDIYITNVYPTFLAVEISKSLSIRVKPIENWLKTAEREVLKKEKISNANSSAYVMLLQLLKMYNFEIPDEKTQLIINLFESDLDNIFQLKSSADIYLPVYLMDYLEICILTGRKSLYNNKIIKILCDKDGIKRDIFEKYDAYGLYATVRTLELAGLKFNEYPRFNKIFEDFDSFLINKFCYIAPGNVESNFVDTYYVDAIIHRLHMEPMGNIKKYCEDNKKTFFHGGAINICHYLELLQRNDLLSIVEEYKQDIIEELLSEMKVVFSKNIIMADNLPVLNACIKGLNILEGKWTIDEETILLVIDSFKRSENVQRYIYDLTELIKFINLVYPNNTDIVWKYCEELEKEIISISEKNVSNKITLQNKSISVLDNCGYTYSNELTQNIKVTLKQSQDNSGLFKGGDSNDDVVNYRNTYEAIVLIDLVK